MKSTNGAAKVHIYEKAREEAARDFGWDADHLIKEYFADLADPFFHHHKEDTLDHEIWGILPEGTPFDVFYFDHEKTKDGYLAILYIEDRGLWLLKSCKKLNVSTFSNNPFLSIDLNNEDTH